MPLSDIDSAYLALIGAIFGGAGLKVVDNLLSRNKEKIDHASHIREELRIELVALREELAKSKEEEHRLETEVESWRTKFYDQFVIITAKTTELTLASNKINSLEHDIEGFKVRILELEKRVAQIAGE